MNNNREMEFTEGFYAKPPGANAPTFIKMKMAVKVDEFGPWLKKKMADPDFDGWINLEIREGKTGKWYTCVDNWKPDANMSKQPARQAAVADDDLPF